MQNMHNVWVIKRFTMVQNAYNSSFALRKQEFPSAHSSLRDMLLLAPESSVDDFLRTSTSSVICIVSYCTVSPSEHQEA